MKVSFELSKRDIRFFRERLKEVRASDSASDESVVIRGAVDLVKEAIAAEPPDFVVERIRKLEKLIEMLSDEDWRLEGGDRVRILDAIAYFVDPDDLIPDRIPGIGYLDDAIMVELVASELTHDIEAYEDFCEYRKRCPKKGVQAKLETRRKALQTRMRRRSRRERSNQRTRSSSSRVRLW
jgi:uncharacterized membrane protein YkvA (DUF1232 family)